jgi:hypothetical protein
MGSDPDADSGSDGHAYVAGSVDCSGTRCRGHYNRYVPTPAQEAMIRRTPFFSIKLIAQCALFALEDFVYYLGQRVPSEFAEGFSWILFD